MRRTLAYLSELRRLSLEKGGASAARITQMREMYNWLDGALSGIKPTDTNNQLEEVMTSADFTYAITEFVQREMVPGYQEKAFAFEPLVKPDRLPNYLKVTRYQKRAGVDDLEYVGEKGTSRKGSVDDAAKRQYRVHRFEKEFDFSMEALINDDLGYFSDQAADMGRAARRSLEKFVSRMMWNATTVARLVGLGALYSTTGRLSSARISSARMAFNQRVNDRGEPILASLRYIVHHPSQVDLIAQINASTLTPEAKDADGNMNAANVIRNTFTAVEDPFHPSTSPNIAWMALSDWRLNGIVPFVLARLSNRPAPLLLRKKSDIEQITSLLGAGGAVAPVMGDFSTSNVVVKVSDVWGTYIDATEGNLFDYRGAFYSDGTQA
mgnify:CR=1 FL=1